MHLRKKHIISVITILQFGFIIISNSLQAQFLQSGQDPASIKWKQINTANFQLIFPSAFEKEANRLANTLDYLYDHVSKSLNHKPKKISVLLHSQSTISNGMVTWAPKRMELYPTPAQDLYAQDWLDQLAVHELRHVVQLDKLNQGITKIVSLLFGQQAIGVVSGLLPRWFLEGDAVNTETALTSAGRGRTASFEMEMKAQVSSRNNLYSYEKALRGSYKDYIPDPYQLGYPMVAWTRKHYGEDVFSNVLTYTAQHPFVLFPFPLSLKKQIGLPSRKLYQATYTDLKQEWTKQIAQVPAVNYTPWNHPKKYYTNYRLPQYINDTTLLVVKSGIDQLTSFVLLYKNGEEKELYTPGNYSIDKLSSANGKFVWSEDIPDLRWDNRSFQCLKIGDIHTGLVKLLTSHTRYFAPSLSPDGSKIAVVEVGTNNDNYLVILNASTGNVLQRISSPENTFLQLPEWLSETEVVLVATSNHGKSLETYDIRNNSWKTLTANTFRNITSQAKAGNYILFTGDYTGTDNLYAYNRKDSSTWQVTNAVYGITDATCATNNNTVFFAQYSSRGFDIVSSPIQTSNWTDLKHVVDVSPRLYEASATQEHFNFQDSVIPNKKYDVKNYSRLAHSINIHSWAPFYYDYSNINAYNDVITPGFSILSQDKLGTCVSTAGYSYDHGFSYIKANMAYKALYPIINFSYSYGGQQGVSRTSGDPLPAFLNPELNLNTQVYVPLNLTRGKYITGLIPQINWQYQNELFYNYNSNVYSQGINYMSYSIYAYRYLKMSLRDLAPKWGASVMSTYSNTPFEITLLSSIWYVKGRVYLPGLLNHHSLRLSMGYQEQDPLLYFFPINYLPFPRGYAARSTYKLTAFTSDYSFPIVYPDLAIGPLAYIKRIRGNFFYDVALSQFKYRSNQQILWGNEQFSSVGFDLTADFHVLRIIFPINSGIRMIYIPELKRYTSQLLLSVDLSNY